MHAPLARSSRLRREQVYRTSSLAAVAAIFGLALVFQSDRWHRTPAYGNLLIILSADVWGCIYLVVAALMLIGLITEIRPVSIAGHCIALALLGTWEFAFFIRWVTDRSTTVANWVSWGVYLYLLFRSASLLRQHKAS